MRDKRFLPGILIALVAAFSVAGAIAVLRGSPDQESPASPGPAAMASSGTVDSNPFAKGDVEATFAMPAPSVAPREGAFSVGPDGDLVLDDDTKVRLDMLIAELPAHPTMNELQVLEAQAVAGLPAHAAEKARRILDRYGRYVKAEAELNAGLENGDAASPETTFDKLVMLRRQHLGAQAADALFARQEARDRHGIQVAMIEADDALTAREKLARIDALQGTHAAEAGSGADLDAARSSLMMEHEVEELRRQGASPDQVQTLRERYAGTEGAKSIGAMEQQKADWERRRHLFAEQRNVIARMGLDLQQEQQRVEALLAQLYSAEEIPAARAYLRLQDRR
jgi:lipase chaperone LimK